MSDVLDFRHTLFSTAKGFNVSKNILLNDVISKAQLTHSVTA